MIDDALARSPGEGITLLRNSELLGVAMPSINAFNGKRSLDYFLLRDVTKSGPVLGFYRGVKINQFVTDRWHRMYEFVGVSSFRFDGEPDCEVLSSGEFILRPGLLYRLVKS